MRQRPGRRGSFRPGTSELEKVQGASTLVFGGLATALSGVDQPAFGEPVTVYAARGEGAGGIIVGAISFRPSPPGASPDLTEPVIAPSGTAAESQPSPSEPLPPEAAPTPPGSSAGIRPSVPAPGASIETPAVQPSAQPQNAPSGAGSGGGAASQVLPAPSGGATALQAVSGASGTSSQAPTSVAPSASGGAQASALGAAVVAAVGGGSTVVSGTSARAIPITGGIAVGKGYAATGGLYPRVGAVDQEPGVPADGSGGDGSGTATGTATGSATGTIGGSQTAPAGGSSQTAAGSSQVGGGTSTNAGVGNGSIAPTTQGSNIVGGHAPFGLPGGRVGAPIAIAPSPATGTPVVYSSHIVSSPSVNQAR
jgi:hypothetical protein